MAGPAVPGVLSGDFPERPHDRQTSGTSHPAFHQPGRRRPARLTIDIVEGRGIWVELDGDLTDGALDQVRARLGRLAQLGFDVVVVGARGIRSIDRAGSRLLGGFVDRVCDDRGVVVIVDPDGTVDDFTERLGRATITCDPPDGAWWLGRPHQPTPGRSSRTPRRNAPAPSASRVIVPDSACSEPTTGTDTVCQ